MRSKATAAVDEYIRAHHGSMSLREIAGACGVSASTVSRRARALGLSGGGVAREAAPAGHRNAPPDVGAGRLERLEEVRDMLRAALPEAGASALPRVSAEYRAVLAEIEELEGAGDGGTDGALGEIARSFRVLAGEA